MAAGSSPHTAPVLLETSAPAGSTLTSIEWVAVMMPREGSANGVAWTDRFLLDVAAIEWAARVQDRWVSRVDFAAESATVRVSMGAAERWFGPFELGCDHGRLIKGLIQPAGLLEPDPWEPIPWIPSSIDRDQGWRKYWAYLLVDMAQYAWALREEPYSLRCERIEVTDGGAVVIVLSRDARWLSFMSLPAAGEMVGMSFEIRDWVEAGGQLVTDGVGAKQLDKYQHDRVELDTWAMRWLYSEILDG